MSFVGSAAAAEACDGPVLGVFAETSPTVGAAGEPAPLSLCAPGSGDADTAAGSAATGRPLNRATRADLDGPPVAAFAFGMDGFSPAMTNAPRARFAAPQSRAVCSPGADGAAAVLAALADGGNDVWEGGGEADWASRCAAKGCESACWPDATP